MEAAARKDLRYILEGLSPLDNLGGEPAGQAPALASITGAFTHADMLSTRHGHRVWRLHAGGRSAILKHYPTSDGGNEIKSYRLLHRLGVPTLHVIGISDQALLLEDLATGNHGQMADFTTGAATSAGDLSPARPQRLADATDISRSEVGEAVAEWYLAFHAAGERLEKKGFPPFLQRETDNLNTESILAAAEKLALGDLAVLRRAAETIERVKAAAAARPTTLNYNDFHFSNLALSRDDAGEMRAIVFDYHLLGIGMRFSDRRNVLGSLNRAARPAFEARYGPADPFEALLDTPLAHLHSLVTAARRPVFPGWAADSLARVRDGRLAGVLDAALDAIGG